MFLVVIGFLVLFPDLPFFYSSGGGGGGGGGGSGTEISGFHAGAQYSKCMWACTQEPGKQLL